MPDLEESRLLGKDAQLHIEQISRHRFLFLEKRVHALIEEVTEHPPDSITFDVLQGDFYTYQGGWSIHAGGTPTQLELHIRLRPAFFAPGFVAKYLLASGAAKTLEAVCAEASRRQNRIR